MLRIDERPLGTTTILDLHGKIAAGDGTIRDAIQSLAARGVRHIVLNFADVTYMDSVGLSTIVRSHLAVRQSGGALALLHVPQRIAELLAITRLTSVFDAFDDETAAVRSVEQRDRRSACC